MQPPMYPRRISSAYETEEPGFIRRPFKLPSMTISFRSYFSLLRTYLRPQWPRVLLLGALLALTIGLQLVNPQIIRYVLDTAQSGAVTRYLVIAAVLFGVFGLVQAGASLAATYVGEDVSWTATNALRADLTTHCLRLDMGFHNTHTPGELIERVDGDVSQLASFFSQLVLRVLANGLLIAGVVVLLFREDWRMGLAGALYAVLLVAILQAVQRRNVRLWSATREISAGLNGFLEERLAGREDVRANGGEGYVMRGLAVWQHRSFLAQYKARMFGAFTFSLTHMLFVLATALGFGLGIHLFLNNKMTIGTVYLIVHYLAMIRDPLEQIRGQVSNLQQATASIRRIKELFALVPTAAHASQEVAVAAEMVLQSAVEHDDTEGVRPLTMTFEDVSFGYAEAGRDESAPKTGATVLENISFNLQERDILGLLGRTGSGKTTLTRLLFRLYDPNAGCIRLNQTDIRALNLRDLRSRIGMVTQEVQLFQATLRDNIVLFSRQVDDERILHVLHELGLWTWYTAQPEGLDTLLQAGGIGLSAGEAQLLAFVRVFLKNPGLVIMDEASSRLDPATEVLLERATDRLLENRTGIIIAHRLSSVRRADKILILEEGSIAEYGSRQTLAADVDSHFYHLLQTGLEMAE